MKKLALTIATFLIGISSLFAHQAEGGNPDGLFGLKAEYLHVLLNPLPVYGLLMGVIVMAAGLSVQSKAARNLGLLLTVVCAASAWPVLYYGQHGYNHLYPQLDTESQEWLHIHMDRAERVIYAFYVTALLGVAALTLQKKFAETTGFLTFLTLVSALVSLVIGTWISRPGGQVSHSEFRSEEEGAPVHENKEGGHSKEMKMPGGADHEHSTTTATNVAQPATNAPPRQSGGETPNHKTKTPDAGPAHPHPDASPTSEDHQHPTASATNRAPANVPTRQQGDEQSHDKMKMPGTRSQDQKNTLTRPSGAKTFVPSTPEGIWTETHKHRTALDSAVKAKKPADVLSQIDALRELSSGLIDLAHPDHKPTVKTGVEKINNTLDDLSKSSQTAGESANDSRIKALDTALKQLEDQMKKQ